MASLLFMYTSTLVSLPGGAHGNGPTLPSASLGGAAAAVLTVLGLVLCAVVLQLLAAAVAALPRLQRLFKQAFCFHDGGGLLLRQQDVGGGTATGEEEHRHHRGGAGQL